MLSHQPSSFEEHLESKLAKGAIMLGQAGRTVSAHNLGPSPGNRMLSWKVPGEEGDQVVTLYHDTHMGRRKIWLDDIVVSLPPPPASPRPLGLRLGRGVEVVPWSPSQRMRAHHRASHCDAVHDTPWASWGVLDLAPLGLA